MGGCLHRLPLLCTISWLLQKKKCCQKTCSKKLSIKLRTILRLFHCKWRMLVYPEKLSLFSFYLVFQFVLGEIKWKKKKTQEQKPTTKTMSCKFFHSQVLSVLLKLCLVMHTAAGGEELGQSRGSGDVLLEKATMNIVSCSDSGMLGGFFASFITFYLLTVARSWVLDFQQHPLRTSSLLHGTFAGVCGVVAGTHRLICPTLLTGLITERAAAPAHPRIPQTLLLSAALDVLTWLCFWMETGGNPHQWQIEDNRIRWVWDFCAFKRSTVFFFFFSEKYWLLSRWETIWPKNLAAFSSWPPALPCFAL